MSDCLPQEVWFDVFTRLPVKTLLQIRSVCKRFNSVISSSAFISTHINKTHRRSSSHSLLLRYFTERERNKKEHYLLLNETSSHCKNSIFDTSDCKELDFPFKTRSNCHFKIVGSCNGLVCLSDDNDFNDSGIILWNPSIKKFLNLPKPRVTQRTHGSYMFVLGFGYDEKSDDYKVVRVAYVKGRSGRDLIPPEVELYKLSSRSWRSFNVGAPPYGIYGYTWLQAFVNGAVHWVGYDPCVAKGNTKCGLIVSFDVGDEVFREVRLPSCLEQSGSDLNVTVLWGKLALLQYNCSVHKRCCCVWVMEEYGVVQSWMKLYSVCLRGGVRQVIGFMRNGEVLGVTARGKLLSYDPATLRMKKLGIHGAKDAFHVESYMESLVLLEAESATLTTESSASGDEREEAKASVWHGVKNRYIEFELEHQEVLENFLSVRIPEENFPKHFCGGYDENGEKLVKELLPEDNYDGWEKKY